MLNWLTRYAPVARELESAPGSVLDVGCGPHGISCVLPERPFVGIDVAFPGPVAPNMVAIEVQPGPLPFPDAAFDRVICLDVLEHLPAAERAPFVAELARVTARTAYVACPTDEVRWLDDRLARELPEPLPEWLTEHALHGLPSRADLTSVMESLPGFAARELPQPNGVLSAAIVIADMTETEHAGLEYLERRAEWLRLLQEASFGPSFRAGWVLSRSEVREAVVAGDSVEALRASVQRATGAR